MNTKKRLKNLRNLAPDYPRIPHLDKKISNMTHDDIELETKISFPLTGWVQEKIDGANMGVSWTSGPVLRNRNHILKKGYIDKDTPAKIQFRSAWNWIHEHGEDIRKLSKSLMTPVTVYGEWMWAKHSLAYDRLPDWFVAYDIYLPEEDKFLASDYFESEISKTNIKFIKAEKITFNDISEIVNKSEMKSVYRNGVTEGIVIKMTEGKYVTESFKVVNRLFERREDFNEELIKNKLLR
jgi:hypothetical protein